MNMTPAFRAARIAQRRFDHDECRRRHEAGETYRELAAAYNVSVTAIAMCCNENTRRAIHDSAARRHRTITTNCVDCKKPMPHYSARRAARSGSEVVCITCAGIRRTKGIRPDELQCGSCRQWKPDDAYQNSRSAPAARRGKHQWCRECNTIHRRAHRAAKPELAAYQNRATRARRLGRPEPPRPINLILDDLIKALS